MNINKLIISMIIGFLTLSTALYHLYLGFLPGWESFTVMFTSDFVGYIILLIAFFLPQLDDYHEYIRYTLIVFALINIIGYVIQNINFLIFDEGIITKTIEIALVIVLLIDKFIENART